MIRKPYEQIRYILVVIVSGLLTFCAQTGAAKAQNVPSCFATPPTPTVDGSFTLSATTEACTELNALLAATDLKDIAWIPGAGLNVIVGSREGGFAANSYALQFRVSDRFNQVFTGKDELVRFGGEEAGARMGSWWTTLESVESNNGSIVGVSEIEDRLALPLVSVPHVVAYARYVKVGTVGYFGIVAPAFGHIGGAVQFWFPPEPVVTGKTQPLQT